MWLVFGRGRYSLVERTVIVVAAVVSGSCCNDGVVGVVLTGVEGL